jgi:hypothetical protein
MFKEDYRLMLILLKGRNLLSKEVEGEALVTSQPISFFGGVNPKTGLIIEKNHELNGKNVTGKVLVFPYGKGSSVGSYVLYAMAKHGTAPSAILNIKTEAIIAVGCALANIPLVDRLNKNPLEVIRTGDWVKIFSDGTVEVKKKA